MKIDRRFMAGNVHMVQVFDESAEDSRILAGNFLIKDVFTSDQGVLHMSGELIENGKQYTIRIGKGRRLNG